VTSRLLHFLNNQLTDGGEVVSLIRRLKLTPGRFVVIISVRGRVEPKAIVRLEGLGN
jgi:UV DNA damage repair endonuclease